MSQGKAGWFVVYFLCQVNQEKKAVLHCVVNSLGLCRLSHVHRLNNTYSLGKELEYVAHLLMIQSGNYPELYILNFTSFLVQLQLLNLS
jgi:hypothetical protein